MGRRWGRGARTANHPEPQRWHGAVLTCCVRPLPPSAHPDPHTPSPLWGSGAPGGRVFVGKGHRHSADENSPARETRERPPEEQGWVQRAGTPKGRLPPAGRSAGVRADGWPFGSLGLSKRSSFFRISVPSLCLSCRAGRQPHGRGSSWAHPSPCGERCVFAVGFRFFLCFQVKQPSPPHPPVSVRFSRF